MDNLVEKFDAIGEEACQDLEKPVLCCEVRTEGETGEEPRDCAGSKAENKSQLKAILSVRSENLLRIVASIIRRGNASRIIVRHGDQVIVNIPVTAGFIGAAMAPWFAFFGGMALMASTLTLEIERPPRV